MYPQQPVQFPGQPPVQPQPTGYAPTPQPLPPAPKGPRKTGLIIGGISAVAVIAAGLAVWALVTYTQEKANIDATVASAEAEVRREVVAEYEDKFLEFQKNPFSTFAGPEDYGRLSFEYPRFWSVYVGRDASRGGTYEAYLNPGSVPPVTATTQLGLRVSIEERAVEQVLSSYQRRVEDGALTSRTVTINGEPATRFDGSFSDDIRGSAVVFRIRDKTVTIRTDAQTFRADFDTLITSITFNK